MNTHTYTNICTCDNQILLTPGCTCETCMGIVPERTEASESPWEIYSAAYFESLEDELLNQDLAA